MLSGIPVTTYLLKTSEPSCLVRPTWSREQLFMFIMLTFIWISYNQVSFALLCFHVTDSNFSSLDWLLISNFHHTHQENFKSSTVPYAARSLKLLPYANIDVLHTEKFVNLLEDRKFHIFELKSQNQITADTRWTQEDIQHQGEYSRDLQTHWNPDYPVLKVW